MNPRNCAIPLLKLASIVTVAVGTIVVVDTFASAATTKIEKTIVIGGQTITLGVDPSIRVDAKDLDLHQLQPLLAEKLSGYRKNEDCGQVLKVSDVQVRPGADGRLVVGAALYAAQWACVHVGYPEWHGLWHVEWKDHIAKTIVMEQGGKIEISAAPVVAGRAIGLDARTDHVEADGLLGALIRALGLEGFIRDQVTDALRNELGKDDLRLKLPQELQAYNTVITSLAFVDLGGGQLGLDLHATAQVTQDQLNDLLKLAISKS
jgi:hypothetical protein